MSFMPTILCDFSFATRHISIKQFCAFRNQSGILGLRVFCQSGILLIIMNNRTPEISVKQDGGIDLLARAGSALKDFWRGHNPGRKRCLILTIWDDGQSINQMDVDLKKTERGNFVVA